jgi:hypothetical protein
MLQEGKINKSEERKRIQVQSKKIKKRQRNKEAKVQNSFDED